MSEKKELPQLSPFVCPKCGSEQHVRRTTIARGHCRKCDQFFTPVQSFKAQLEVVTKELRFLRLQLKASESHTLVACQSQEKAKGNKS